MENKNIKQSYLNYKEFTNQLGLESKSKASIIQFYGIIKEKIKTVMHKT